MNILRRDESLLERRAEHGAGGVAAAWLRWKGNLVDAAIGRTKQRCHVGRGAFAGIEVCFSAVGLSQAREPPSGSCRGELAYFVLESIVEHHRLFAITLKSLAIRRWGVQEPHAT